eukprot:COSAG01_NODE_21999_length_876_cov_2.120978_1_plen_69_part_01
MVQLLPENLIAIRELAAINNKKEGRQLGLEPVPTLEAVAVAELGDGDRTPAPKRGEEFMSSPAVRRAVV